MVLCEYRRKSVSEVRRAPWHPWLWELAPYTPALVAEPGEEPRGDGAGGQPRGRVVEGGDRPGAPGAALAARAMLTMFPRASTPPASSDRSPSWGGSKAASSHVLFQPSYHYGQLMDQLN